MRARYVNVSLRIVYGAFKCSLLSRALLNSRDAVLFIIISAAMWIRDWSHATGICDCIMERHAFQIDQTSLFGANISNDK